MQLQVKADANAFIAVNEIPDQEGPSVSEGEQDLKKEMLTELTNKQSQLKNLKVLLAIILMFLFAFGFLLFFEFRSRSRTTKALTSANEELSAQQQKLTAAMEFLVESEAKYKSLVENSPTGILLLNPGGQILEVNRKMLQILGSPGPEETKKINCLEFPPLKAIGLSADLQDCAVSGESLSRRVEYETKWGRKVHLNYNITPIKDNKGKVKSLILNAEDISETVNAERSRLESELKYHILVENSLQAMLIVQGGKVIFANSKFGELSGYSEKEIQSAGRRWLNLMIHPDDKRRSYKNVKDALERNHVSPMQVYKIIRKDGALRIMETLSAVVELNEKPAMLIVAIDITENTMSKEKLIESEKRLRELNAMKDKFFSIIAHDLKNPFSSILGFSNLLNEAYDNFTEKQRKSFIKNICEASENTFKLLQNLLEWSRTQTGKIEFLPEILDLNSIVRDSLSILKSGFARKNIQVETSLPEGITVYADENMIKLVIRNLISNALKFTHAGGRVELLAKIEDGNTVISIKDDGVGIKKEDLIRLFRIDDQLKTKGTADETGSGLGLILCREFIEQNNGRIWVNSTFGKGSMFHFTLPTCKPRPTKSESS